jgi:ankyrin repeat protein
MVPVNYFVLADESQMLYSEKGVASEMRALFWDEETQNDLDLSPLHQALLSQDTPLQESHVQLFSAYLNARNAAGVTPLMWAARRGDARSLRLLLEHGADPNLKSRNSATALHYAANYGTEACVRLLLEYGAAPCVPEQSNMQPIHCVWSNLRHGECPRGKTEALLQYGADINARGYEGMTPITQVGHIRGDASALDAVNIVRYLIEAGADMDAENDEGLRVVDYAVAGGNALLVRYLLGIGAELGLKPSGKSTSIIHMAAMSAGVEMWGILKDLVQQGSFPDLERHFVDSDQLTPWHVFENCRYQYGYGDWQNYEAERGKFAELMDAVERAMPTKPVYLVPPPRRDTLINVVQ